MPIHTDRPAPYAPLATVLSIISGYRDRGLATPFTLEVLERAGVTTSLAPRTLAALRTLDLIDESGQPTESLNALRVAASDDYEARLAEVVRAAYEDIFQFADPAVDPRSRIEDAFRPYKPAGQRKRMVILFLGLCQAAGIIPEDAPAAKTIHKSSTHSRKPRSTKKKASTATSRRGTAQSQSNPQISSSGIPAPIAGLMAALPANGWTQADRKKFVDAFGVVLDICVPIREEDERPQTEPVEEEV